MPPEYQIYLISDLHIGYGKANDFHNHALLMSFLRDLHIRNSPPLILIGDILECWQMNLERLLWEQATILYLLLHYPNLTYLHGNHDYMPFSKYTLPSYKNDGLFAIHGHQFDIFNNQPENCIGRTVAKLFGWLERIIHPDIDEWAWNLLPPKDKITPTSKKYPGDFTEYEGKAQQILKDNPDIDVIAMGHTHKPMIKIFPEGIYLNTGTWSGTPSPTYAVIQNNLVELRNAENHQLITTARRARKQNGT